VKGKIDWFGGLNRQRGTINNFGFIVPLEGDYREGIYVARRDVPPEFQALLEREKGIYVEFEIVRQPDGRKRAINVEIQSVVGIVGLFEEGQIGYGEGLNIQLPSSIGFQRGDLVLFFIKCNATGKDEAILVKKVQFPNEDETINKKAQVLIENTGYKGKYWNIMSKEIKKDKIKNKYQKFFSLLFKFNQFEYPFDNLLRFPWEDLYELDENDQQLVDTWATKRDKFTLAKMISARGAEKFVMKFYQSLGFSVEDTSIHQITKQSNIWLQGDIMLDGETLLDVKNARTSVNSDTYSEFCVPNFKQNRGNNIPIVAVLSPYLQYDIMVGDKEPHFFIDNPLILGEFDRGMLNQLENKFNDATLSIDLSKNSDSNSYLPPWLFDYNHRFYVNQKLIKDELLNLENSEIPTWEDLTLCKVNPLPLFLSSKRLPHQWNNYFSKWKMDFMTSLINACPKDISMPYLFLTILKHFLHMLANGEELDYSPIRYFDVLFTKSDDFLVSKHPLGLYDPQDIIFDFCNTLQTLWTHRHSANLTSYKIFKFNGKGLLLGKKSLTDELWTTILAYCGGWVEGKGKCGYRPLVIGKHRNCAVCGHLICPKENCGFCSNNCEEYQKRRKEI